MSPTSLPIPDFQDGPQNALRDEILSILEKFKIQYDKSIVGVVSFVPIFFNFGSVASYASASERTTVLRNVKTNIAAIVKQFEVSFDKMDNLNKANVNNYLLRVVINNVVGKSSTSKKAMFYPDGTMEITTVFEDGLNCQYYLEKKVMTCLNEFRPSVGSSVSQKVETFVQPTTPPPEAVRPIEPPKTESAINIDLSIPNYPNAQWETFKNDAVNACKPMKFELVFPGPAFEVPVSIDWQSIPLSGPDYSVVLKSLKTNIPSILKQVIPGIKAVDEFRKAIIRDFFISIVFQNVAGKASTSKRCFLSAEGSLVIVVPFEDGLNCSYYFEKKITTGLNEFIPPQGVTAPSRINTVPTAVQPTPVVVQQEPVFAPSYGIGSLPPQQQPVYVPPVVQQQQPVYVQPVVQQQPPQQPQYQPQYTSYVQPKPVEVVKPVEVPKVREPPKEKGRPEMEERPAIEDPASVFLLREIDYIISQMKVLDEKDQYFGVPVYIDWKSIMVYPSAVKQATVIRNVNLVLYRLLRDVLNAIKLSCTDYINKDNIVEYLRSVTLQHQQGSSPSLKKVVYEDGHLTVQTTFEDFGNCALYFDSKVIQALGSKPTQPAPKKPELSGLIKEELPLRLMAHQGIKNKKGEQVSPICPVEMDWSFLTVKANDGAGIENNLISLTNPLLTDLFLAILSFDSTQIAILMKEVTKIIFIQAVPGKTIFDKRSVVFLDNGVLQITTTFEDKLEGIKTFKERFTWVFKSRLSKVIIRDQLVPELKAMIERAVKVEYKGNYLDNIPVQEYKSYECNVQFDWQLIEKEATESQVGIYASLVEQLKVGASFPLLFDKSIRDICSYDVGKNAFLPNVTFILRNIIKFKEENVKFVGGTTWEFYISFHDVSKTVLNAASLTRQFKEKLNVAFPCAIQDTFPVIDDFVEELQSATGKKVPLVMKYDTWRKSERFTSDPLCYRNIDEIACKTPFSGLAAIIDLCKDNIVKREYNSKVNTIEIHYDTNNKVKGHRSKDPNVIAKLVNGVLAFTLNFDDGRDRRMPSWDFQLEYVLGTRQLKIQRAIENAKADLTRASKNLTTLIGKPIGVEVDYSTFIHNDKFLYDLEEPVYTKVISSFYSLTEAGWVNDNESAQLLSYETLKKSIQSQLNNIKFRINCDSAQRENYEFSLNAGELTVGLNLTSACSVATKSWRLDMERIIKLRDLRVQEEIAKRIDYSSAKTQILSYIGKSVTLTIDWQSIITNPDFSKNITDYCSYLHKFSEGITKELAKPSGFGKLCEYPEVQSLVQGLISEIRIQATTTDGFGIDYQKSSKTVVASVGIRNINSYLTSSQSNYEEYGRKIENEIGVRVPCIKAFIKRNEPEVVSYTKSRLREAVEQEVGFVFDWENIIEHPSFARIQDPVPTLKNILALGAELTPIVQLCKENFQCKSELKSSVKNYTIFIDGQSRVNESEFAENYYGVDWAKVAWKNLPAKDHLQVTVNLDRLIKNTPNGLEIHLKVEALITPDKALDRYQRKMDEIHRQEEADANDRFRRDQMRMDQKMLDASRENNRQLESLNRKFRR